ncbi:MAG: ABC transporter permease subunit [Halovenus sp.]
MRWQQVARKDVGDAIRGRQLHLLVGFFLFVGLVIGYAATGFLGGILVLLLAFLAPLVGLAFTQQSIVGKRSSHELTVLLGLPFSRRDVVVGTLLGRAVLLAAALVSIYVGTTVGAVVSGTAVEIELFVVGLGLSLALGLIFVSIALGISTATRSTTLASLGAFGAYLLFVFQLWGLLPDGVRYLLNGFSLSGDRPTWALVFEQLSPFAAVRNATAGVSAELADSFPVVARAVPEDPPVYMEPWAGVLIAVVWFLVPVGLGYLQFARSDL